MIKKDNLHMIKYIIIVNKYKVESNISILNKIINLISIDQISSFKNNLNKYNKN